MFEIFFIILGLVMLAYAWLLKIKKRRVQFTRFFVWFGLVLMIYGMAMIYFQDVIPSFVLWLTRILFLLFFLSFVFIEIKLVKATYQKPPVYVDALIVLGAGLFGDRLSLSLKRRLDLAIQVGANNPNILFVVCGGQGPDEWISEAKAMHDYLVASGIEEKRIYQEDQSTSTYENLSYAIEKFDLKKIPVGIVTNSFHLCRSVRMAKKLGLNAYGFGTAAPHLTSPVFYTREYFAFIKAKLKRQI